LDKLRALSIPALASCAVLSLFSVVLRADNAFYHHLESWGAVDVFLWALLVGAAASCLLLMINPLKPLTTRFWTFVVLSLVFTLLGLALSQFATQTLLVGAGGLLLGGGLVMLLVEWLSRFPLANGDDDSLLVGGTVILLVASLFWAVFIFFDNPSLSILGAFALALIGALPLLLSSKGGPGEAFPDDSSTHAADATTDGISDASTGHPVGSGASLDAAMTLKQIVLRDWGAVFGLAFNLFTLGLTFHPDVAGMGVASFSFKPGAYLMILAALWMVTALRRKPTGEGYGDGDSVAPIPLYRILLPVGTAIMLASPFMSDLVPFDVLPGLSSLPYLGVGLLYLVGLNTLAVLMRLGRARALPLIAAALLFCCAGMAAGVVVFNLLGQSAQIFSLCLLSLFFVALMMTALYETGNKQREVARASAMTVESRFAQNCQTFARHFDLSPRETEILIYLARGRGSIWIGNQLSISPETVRTHCKRIYDKTGVHNKEDLIDAVDAVERTI
jgi:DNA-binding CsgD family transcriptional regulator